MELSQISYGHSWCTFVTKCVNVWAVRQELFSTVPRS